MSEQKESTLAALLKEKPKRGRPRRAVTRENVYIALSQRQKQQMRQMARDLPEGLGRADLADMAVRLLAVRLELLRQAVADRNREFPEGITDFDSLYLLWDLPLPEGEEPVKWTSIRLSPQQAIDLGRAQGALKALFGASRSQVFALALALLERFLATELSDKRFNSVEQVERWIARIYL